MNTLKDFISALSNAFETKERPNGEDFICVCSSSPVYEQVKNIVRDAHDGYLPIDQVYSAVQDILVDMSDTVSDTDDLQNYFYEVQGTEFSNYQIHTLPNFGCFVDQALENYGCKSHYSLIEQVTFLFFTEICESVKNSIQDYCDEDDGWTEEE